MKTVPQIIYSHATLLLEQGVDIRFIQSWLGSDSLKLHIHFQNGGVNAGDKKEINVIHLHIRYLQG